MSPGSKTLQRDLLDQRLTLREVGSGGAARYTDAEKGRVKSHPVTRRPRE